MSGLMQPASTIASRAAVSEMASSERSAYLESGSHERSWELVGARGSSWELVGARGSSWELTLLPKV